MPHGSPQTATSGWLALQTVRGSMDLALALLGHMCNSTDEHGSRCTSVVTQCVGWISDPWRQKLRGHNVCLCQALCCCSIDVHQLQGWSHIGL